MPAGIGPSTGTTAESCSAGEIGTRFAWFTATPAPHCARQDLDQTLVNQFEVDFVGMHRQR
jgi:hypothetical protein